MSILKKKKRFFINNVGSANSLDLLCFVSRGVCLQQQMLFIIIIIVFLFARALNFLQLRFHELIFFFSGDTLYYFLNTLVLITNWFI